MIKLGVSRQADHCQGARSDIPARLLALADEVIE
jgi:hypothetical protein